jgi:SAM-dependent methyltransferase
MLRVDGLVSGVRAAIKRRLYEGFGRARWQRADEVVSALGLRPGAHVADLGAGAGYFTFHLANAVGPAGKVYAVDVDEDLQAYVARAARARGIANVETIRGARDDPRLPAPVDFLFSSDAYHHLRNGRRTLRGRAGICVPAAAPPSSTTCRRASSRAGSGTEPPRMSSDTRWSARDIDWRKSSISCAHGSTSSSSTRLAHEPSAHLRRGVAQEGRVPAEATRGVPRTAG